MKQLYTYCDAEGNIIGLLEFENKPQYSTSKIYNGNYLKPKLNFETDEFYEGATAQELLDFAKSNVPQMVSLAAFKSILILSGLITDVENALQDLQEPTKTIALVYWETGNFVERYSQTVLLLQNELSLTDEQVDNLFTQANNITI